MEKVTYQSFEKQSKSKYNRVCINGKTVGCSKCVGYCTYEEHSGFITETLCKKHDCIGKECHYYIAKPSNNKAKKDLKDDFSLQLISMANSLCCDMEGLKILKAVKIDLGYWLLSYITLSNDYPVDVLRQRITDAIGINVCLEKLNYKFDVCAAIILQQVKQKETST